MMRTQNYFYQMQRKWNKIKQRKSRNKQRSHNIHGTLFCQRRIKNDEEKIKAISKMQERKNLKELRRFIGMNNYPRLFIQNYNKIMLPCTELLKKDVTYTWSNSQETSFKNDE